MKNDKDIFANWAMQETESAPKESTPVADVPDDVKAVCAAIKQEQAAAQTQATADNLSAKDALVIEAVRNSLALGKNQRPVNTMENYETIINQDTVFKSSTGESFGSLRWNISKGTPEVLGADPYTGVKRYVAVDNPYIVQALAHIEKYYGLCKEKTLVDTITAVASKKQFDPIRGTLDVLKWDGVPRIEGFLTRWACADDTAYTREASRLLFAMGIHRAFDPGCDIDGALVFVSPVQGCGKSTLCKWLSMGMYSSLGSIEGREAVENLAGKWLIELEELKALQGRYTSVESIRRFVTGTNDYYRNPYERAAKDHPRTCFFIGTTNNENFLSDPAGDRRFFPIAFNQTADYLFSHAAECRHDIEQCWGEALARFKQDKLPNHFDRGLLAEAEQIRQAATIEDEWVEYIEQYLSKVIANDPNVSRKLTPDRKPAVCASVIYTWLDSKFNVGGGRAFENKTHGQRISQIMARRKGWIKGTKPGRLRFDENGEQVRHTYWYYQEQK